MRVQEYDVFTGHFDRDPLWLDRIEGLDAAYLRMTERAADSPGPYFIFCTESNSVIATVDTSRANGAAAGDRADSGARSQDVTDFGNR